MLRLTVRTLLALFAVATASGVESPSDWPMFRGDPALLGVTSTPLPQKPALLWKFKTGGPVKSSAVIAAGKAFVGSSDSNVYALDLRTGNKLWAYKTTGSVEAPGLVADGKLFIGSMEGVLYALETETGKLLWQYQTDGKILGAPNIASSPDKALRVLIGSYDFKLHCVDAQTGKSNWVYETGNYINGSPAVADGKTVFGGCDGLLHIISVANGTQLKELEAGAYVAASVALAGNRAYFGHYENEFLCIDLGDSEEKPLPKSAVPPADSKTPAKNSDPSAAAKNESATNVVWRYKNRAFPYMSSAAVTTDRVVVGGRDKLLHCITRATGEKIWTFATQGKVDSSPVVAGDKVVVGSDDGRVYLVSLASGKELWSYEIGEAIDSSPAVADGKIVIGSNDGSVYCFGEKPK